MKKSAFRTTEISEEHISAEGLRFITIKSPHLQGRGDLCVYIPRGVNTENLPMVTLLHGVYGSAWVWALKGGAHLTLQRLVDEGKVQPMGLLMPSDGLWGDGSAYLPHHQRDFMSWIAEDLPTAAMENFPAFSPASPRFISGLSMGGFGALVVGGHHASRYQGISAHSAITDLEQMADFVEESWLEMKKASDFRNAFQVLSRAGKNLPPLRFDCGKDDDLAEANRLLSRQLQEAGIAHAFEEFPGAHEWSYWNRHLEDTLVFFDQIIQDADTKSKH